MKLLIITQKVNKNDSILGFFHRWIVEFSKHFESIVVICLEKGLSDLPDNVKVLSLGKENSVSKVKYLVNFYKFIWQERKNYDAVFVHMNQEYVLLGGLFWRLLGKKITMWRNHHAGSILTDISSVFCSKVFCTSKFSYTAKYKKTVLMPVGIDTDLFFLKKEIVREPHSILFLSRIAPVKRPDLLLEALMELKRRGINFKASFFGDPLPIDQKFYQTLKDKVKDNDMNDCVQFCKGIPNEQTVEIYNQHKIFVNLSTSGMYDKTIFEAMACGCLVLASNKNLRGLVNDRFIFEEGNLNELQSKLKDLLTMSAGDKHEYISNFKSIAVNNSLDFLAKKLAQNIK